MATNLQALQPELSALCRRYRVRRLDVFGSAATGKARADSDIDLLVDLTGTNIRSLLALGSVYCDLESALGKSIDLLPVSSLEQGSQSASDALFRDAVQKERVRIYDAVS